MEFKSHMVATLRCENKVSNAPTPSCFVYEKVNAQIYLKQLWCAKNFKWGITDKLKLTGQNLGRVYNFRRCCVYAMNVYYYETKLPNL